MVYFSDKETTRDQVSARDLADADMCPHCEADHSLIAHISRELDSFGTGGIYLSCNDCREEYLANATLICDDCLESFPIDEVLSYRPYGFNPSDGDEELQLCDDCATQPLHLQRLAADRRLAALDEGDFDEDHNEEY